MQAPLDSSKTSSNRKAAAGFNIGIGGIGTFA